MRRRPRVLLGGSFDPPTIAHTRLIEITRRHLPQAEIVVVVSGQPPHKTERARTSTEVRLELARLAFADMPGVRVSDEECRRPGPSYTVDTLARHRAELGEDDLYWLIGGDSLLDLSSWREPHRILELARVLTIARPGFPIDDAALDGFGAREQSVLRAGILEASGPDVSSSEVRRLLREGRPVDGLVQPAVLEAIRARRLYEEPCS